MRGDNPPPLAVPQPPIPPHSSINPHNPDPTKTKPELMADMGIDPPPKSTHLFPRMADAMNRMVFSPTLLRNARIRAGLSMRKAGIMYGMSPRTAGNWTIYENGTVTDPRPRTIAGLAAVVGVTPDTLMQAADAAPARIADPIADARAIGEGIGYHKASADFEALKQPLRMEGYHKGHEVGYAAGVRKETRAAYEAGWFDGYEAHKRGDGPQVPDLAAPPREPWFKRAPAPTAPLPEPTPAPIGAPEPLPIPDYQE